MSYTQAVPFNYTTWVARYPEFLSVPSGTAQLYFNEACLYCDNTVNSIITDQGILLMLLNMLTAHIAALNFTGSSPLVGRPETASEGNVSVTTKYVDPVTDFKAWCQQTKYGAAYLAASRQYSGFVYVAGPQTPGVWPPNPYIAGLGSGSMQQGVTIGELNALMLALPTSPGMPGTMWNNGGVICVA